MSVNWYLGTCVAIWLGAVGQCSATSDVSCGQFSSRDSDDYWISVGRCPSCTSLEGCGFCESSLQCLDGTELGPSGNMPCLSWSFQEISCPVAPNCQDYLDCSACASQDQCAWCASDTSCSTISEAFSKDCRGLVFEAPCPEKMSSGTTSTSQQRKYSFLFKPNVL